MSYKKDFNKAYSKLNKINTNLKKDEENEVLLINTLLPIMLNTIKKCKTKKINKNEFSYKLPAILLIIFLLFFFSFYYIQLIILLFVAMFVYRIFF